MSILWRFTQKFWWSRLRSLDKRYNRKRAKALKIECPVKRDRALQKLNGDWLYNYCRIMEHIDIFYKEEDL